jgi:hypothetical protein
VGSTVQPHVSREWLLVQSGALAPHGPPFDGLFLFCVIAVAIFLSALVGLGRGEDEQERVKAARLEAERIHRADEAWFRSAADRAGQFAGAGARSNAGQAGALSEAAAGAALRAANARAAKAARARVEAQAAADRAQQALDSATAEWDAALHAAAWARHDWEETKKARARGGEAT